MSLIGKKAPHFKTAAVINGKDIVENFSLDQYLGKKYVVFFFYPKDFTFVCPSELHAFQAELSAFEERNCAVVACSTDTAESHYGWLRLAKNEGGIAGITYPIVADTDKTVADAFDVLAGEYFYDEEGNLKANGEMIAYRGLFIMDKQGIVHHATINNFPIGRSVEEAIRVLDALQYVEEHGEVCPANWKKGEKAMRPTVAGVADYLK